VSKIRIPVSTLPVGVPGLVRWVKYAHPAIYQKLGARIERNLALQGLGLVAAKDTVTAAAATPGLGAKIVGALKDLISVGLPLYQQQKVFDLQLKRAAQNLAPLDTAALSEISSVKVGIDAPTRNTGLLVVGGLAAALVGYKLLTR